MKHRFVLLSLIALFAISTGIGAYKNNSRHRPSNARVESSDLAAAVAEAPTSSPRTVSSVGWSSDRLMIPQTQVLNSRSGDEFAILAPFDAQRCEHGQVQALATIKQLQSGAAITGAKNLYGEVENDGYLYVAARINLDGTVGDAIDLNRPNPLPNDSSWQIMVWPKQYGATGAVTYAVIGSVGKVEIFTNTSAGYSGEGIVNRGCNCFVDSARQISQQRTLEGRCCAHGSEKWVAVD